MNKPIITPGITQTASLQDIAFAYDRVTQLYTETEPMFPYIEIMSDMSRFALQNGYLQEAIILKSLTRFPKMIKDQDDPKSLRYLAEMLVGAIKEYVDESITSEESATKMRLSPEPFERIRFAVLYGLMEFAHTTSHFDAWQRIQNTSVEDLDKLMRRMPEREDTKEAQSEQDKVYQAMIRRTPRVFHAPKPPEPSKRTPVGGSPITR